MKTPLHVQITDLLRKQINAHQLLPQSKLPSERELCEQYKVSRITVRKALTELTHEGLIHSIAGKGSYVAVGKLQRILEPLKGFSNDILDRGMLVSSQVLESEVIHADSSLANRLGLLPLVEVVKLRRLRLVNSIPVVIQCAYLPHHLCPDLLKYDFSSLSLLDVLRNEYQLRLVSAKSDIEANLADSEETSLLELPTPAAVLVSEQTTYLHNDVAIEFVRSVFAGNRYKFHK